MMSKPLAALLFVATSTTAYANDFELGARVGGYGFRRNAQEEWNECRMNGFGVFGGRALRGPLFVEAGIDMYSSLPAAQPTDLPIDRTSGLFSGAVGARTQIASWLRGYVQLGGGLELTRVSVPYGDGQIRDNKALPEGFFGIGLDIKLAKGTHLGTSFRTLVMGNFDYDPARLEMKDAWAWKPTPDVVFDASPDVAAQVQFYVRREL
ncbi:MAG TPA: outer membrane beta-barrel protein [Kofleriaceae bacterium]